MIIMILMKTKMISTIAQDARTSGTTPASRSFTRAPTFNQRDKDLIYFVHPLYNILMYLIDISSGIELLYNNAKGSFGGYVTEDVI